MINFSHTPVLLKEAVDSLMVVPNGKYIDATLGGGGHSKEIIKRGGIVLGIDQDEDAIGFVSKNLSKEIKEGKLKLFKGNFKDIAKISQVNDFNLVNGILFDLGVSSYHLDSAKRGFSIKNDEELDMRMDKQGELTAYKVVNSYPQVDLRRIFLTYGEEHNASKIASEIVELRKKSPIRTTRELARIAEGVSHKSESIHPATRIFQAIRIEVNDELNAIKYGLTDAIELLKPEARLSVISFHSLEDRIVKHAFIKASREGLGSLIYKKPLTATFEENVKNRRSRSAKLRTFEKK